METPGHRHGRNEHEAHAPPAAAPAPTTAPEACPGGNLGRRFLDNLEKNFDAETCSGTEPLFTTDLKGAVLWRTYLSAFRHGERLPHQDCTACRGFIEEYGGLVTIDDESGETMPVMWTGVDDRLPNWFDVEPMVELISGARVTGVFSSMAGVWGTPTTGSWRHLAVFPERFASIPVWYGKAPTRRIFQNVRAALTLVDPQVLQGAAELMKSRLADGEDDTVALDCMLALKHWMEVAGSCRSPDNVLWHAIALAPAEFFHPRGLAAWIKASRWRGGGVSLPSTVSITPTRKRRGSQAPEAAMRPGLR